MSRYHPSMGMQFLGLFEVQLILSTGTKKTFHVMSDNYCAFLHIPKLHGFQALLGFLR